MRIRRGQRPTFTASRTIVGTALTGALCVLASPAPPAAAAQARDTAFFIDASGGLTSFGLGSGGTWSDAVQLGPAGLAPAGAPVTATPVQDGSVAAFFAGSNGAVYVGCPGQSSPAPVTASGVAQPGGAIGAALAGTAVLVAFAGAADGLDVTALISNPCTPPHPPKSVATILDSASWAATGGQLTVAGLADGEFGVFCFDRTGAGRALWRSAGGTWSESVTLPAGTAAPGGSIAVTPSSGASALSLFYTGQDGHIYLAYPLAGGGLAASPQPDPETSSATVPANARLAASSGPAGSTVSYVADNGTVTVLPVSAQGNWQDSVLVSGPGFAAAGSPLASTATASEVDIFGSAESGSPGHIAYVPEAGGSGTWLPSAPPSTTTSATAFAAAG
jgi:hypothetical protein